MTKGKDISRRGFLFGVAFAVMFVGSSMADITQGFRIMSYNVKHGEGMDKRLDLSRTADVVKRTNPTYVGLQEIDQMTRRIGGTNTCEFISARCGMHATFAKAMPYQGGEYGNALLSRETPLSVRKYPLPPPPNRKKGLREPRVLVMCEFKDFWVGTMHINGEPSSIPLVRRAVEECAATKPVFVTGDWNACPKTVVLKLMKEFMTILSPTDRPTVNDFGNCIDYIAVDTAHAKDFEVEGTDVIQELVASDHRPIYVDVKSCERKEFAK